MRRPDFGKIKKVIAIAELLGLKQRIRRAETALRNIYLALGGRKSASAYKNGGVAALKREIKEILEQTVTKACSDLLDADELLSKFHESEGTSLHYDVLFSFSAEKEEAMTGPVAVVQFEVPMIFCMYAGVVVSLKEDRPMVYELLRRVLAILGSEWFPVTSVSGAYNYLSEMFEEGDDSNEDFRAAVECSYNDYMEHIGCLEGLRNKGKLLKEIRGLYRQAALDMTIEEQWFVRTFLELCRIWGGWSGKKVDFVHSYYGDDRNSMESFFNLLWNEDDALSEEKNNEFHNVYGNEGAPALIMAVKDKPSLKEVLKVVKSHMLFNALYAGGYRIWNSGK